MEPWGAQAEARGLAVIIYSGKFLKERRSVAQRWMDAYLKGCHVYAEKDPHDSEVLAVLEKFTKIPAKAIKTAIPHYQSRDGRPVLESLTDQISWFVANRFMPEKISVDRLVDLSFRK